MLRRFLESAQIGGQLQHPGIVPVYELGVLEVIMPKAEATKPRKIEVAS